MKGGTVRIFCVSYIFGTSNNAERTIESRVFK
jgi:hypothetical protein